MAKRKQDQDSMAQMDMFGDILLPPPTIDALIEPANDTWVDQEYSRLPEAQPSSSTPLLARQNKAYRLPLADEWWTLAMVCAYLKVGRKAVWERQRDKRISFPKPVCHGSSRPRWRSDEIRQWANQLGEGHTH